MLSLGMGGGRASSSLLLGDTAPGDDQFLTREQRIATFGLDCVDALEWRDWLPGGEYRRAMLIKNVSNKVRHKSAPPPGGRLGGRWEDGGEQGHPGSRLPHRDGGYGVGRRVCFSPKSRG